MSEDSKFARMVDDEILNGTPLGAYRKGLRDGRAAAAAEIARLTRERDEAQAKERERCLAIIDEVVAAIRGGKP